MCGCSAGKNKQALFAVTVTPISETSSSSSSLSTGQIVAIVVGCVAILFANLSFFYYYRKMFYQQKSTYKFKIYDGSS